MRKFIVLLLFASLVAGCATFSDPNLTPEQRQARIDAAVGFGHAALAEIFALTGSESDLGHYLAEHPEEAAHAMNLARLAINGAIFAGAKPEVVSVMKSTFYRYTGEPFDIFEELEE